MDSPIWFVLAIMGFIIGAMLLVSWQNKQGEKLKEQLSNLPERAVFRKVNYRLWQLTEISWGEAEMIVIENGFFLLDGNTPDYFFTYKNYHLNLPTQTNEWVLKGITLKGKKLIIKAASNDLNSRRDDFHFNFASPEEAGKVVAAFEKFNLKITVAV